jgi:uncharacterized membrane protein
MKRITVGWATPTMFSANRGQCPAYIMLFAACVVMVALTAGDAVACPMCKAALGSHDGSHGDLVGGFFWSILFMLSMPFLIFGSLSTYMYLLVRRARREQSGRKTAAAVGAFVDAPAEEHLREPVKT